MCPKFLCLLLVIWMVSFESNGQTILTSNSGCNGCPLAQTSGNVYGGYPLYPQYGQVYYQYPYYTQQVVPYPYINSQQQPVVNQQIPNINYAATGNTPVGNSKTLYDNVKTEIIDIDPKYFRYLYSNYFPQSVRTPSSRRTVARKQSPYVVKIDSQQHNNTNVPQVIKKHDVQHKTFTFKKTFVLNPDENKNSVINLNFVNGVPVTTEVAEDMREETTIKEDTVDEPVATTEQPQTTTENENPKPPIRKDGRRFIDVPDSCPENTVYLDGECWKKFSLHVTDDETSDSKTNQN